MQVASPASQRDSSQENLLNDWLNQLTLEQKVGQLFVLEFFGELASDDTREKFQKVHRLVREGLVGGLVIINRIELGEIKRADPFAALTLTNYFQQLSPIPLLIAGDFERGASMRIADLPA